MACIADARTAAEYTGLLGAAGLVVAVSEPHDEALTQMIEQIEGRLRAVSLLGLPGVPDLGAVRRVTSAANRAVASGVAGYHLIVADKRRPAPAHRPFGATE